MIRDIIIINFEIVNKFAIIITIIILIIIISFTIMIIYISKIVYLNIMNVMTKRYVFREHCFVIILMIFILIE